MADEAETTEESSEETTETTETAVATETTETVETAETQETVTNWRDVITDENARKEAKNSTDVNALAMRVSDMRKSLSTAFQPLRANAKAEDVAKFRKAIGTPERVEDYEIPELEGIDTEMLTSPEVAGRLKTFAEAAHAGHVTKGAFTEMVKVYFAEKAKEDKAFADADTKFAEEGQKALDTEWGVDKPRELALANRGAEWAAGDEIEAFRGLKTADDRLVADHPMVVKMMNKIGRAVNEDFVGSFPVNTEQLAGLQTQLSDLISKQADFQNLGEHDKAQAMQTEIVAVSTKISGDGPIVGATL